jgi:hypothetical protein
MMPPVVLYDPNGQELGGFEKETFDRAFTLQTAHASAGVGDYQKELDQLLDTTTPVQANIVLNRIINKFGTDQAHRAFMTYSQKGTMKGKPTNVNTTYSRSVATIFKEAK